MISIIYAVVVFGLLIFVHELGHFLIAKRLGVGVLKFSLGFGPAIFSRKIGETEYLISALPLGGYVKMIGEHDDDVAPEDMSRSFSNKSTGAKIAIVAAGPVFNVIFAALLYTCSFMIGIPIITTEVGSVKEGYPAYEAGIKVGDKITSVDGEKVSRWDELSDKIQKTKKDLLSIELYRAGTIMKFNLKPTVSMDKNMFGEDIEVKVVGIGNSRNFIIEKSNPFDAVGKGLAYTWSITELTVIGIVKLAQGVIPSENIGGPILIAKMAGEQANQGLLSLLSFMALLSINLGVINLFPVPVLDGGHIVFFVIEGIIRRPISDRFKEVATNVGLFLLICLMVFAFWNDINRFFFN